MMLPKLKTAVPGPKSRKLARALARFESPNVTFLGPPGPIFWKKAADSHVWDVDGNRYLDLTSAFGVASLGHTPPSVRNSIQRQASSLVHGMGDVHPTELKVQLLRELSRLTFERWTGGRIQGQSVLGNSGFEAVEIALKTALLKTGRNRIVAFHDAYHGVGFGALQATWRGDFRRPFSAQLRKLSTFLPYPRPGDDLSRLDRKLSALLKTRKIGAILVEPVQGRGGIVIPPREFLPLLRRACDRSGALLIADEIFTGFWRTGRMFAVEHSGTVPDLICLGKALTGALPLSACVGKKSVMNAWPRSRGEAIHTTTFLGNPLACAAAIASLGAWKRTGWGRQVNSSGAFLGKSLRQALGGRTGIREIRGIGLMFGIELAYSGRAARISDHLLRGGILTLPEGTHGEVLAITPPFPISKAELTFAIGRVQRAFDEVA